MSKIDPAELIKQQDLRAFVQWGGPGPANLVYFAGQGAQYMFIDGVSNPVSGDLTPIRVPHPRIRGAYKLVARSRAAPDLASATLTIHEKHGPIPRQLMNYECAFNFYEYAGKCANLSDKATGFDDYVLVYSYAVPTSNDLGTRFARDSDDALASSVGVSLAAIYPVGKLAFGEEAATTVTLEVKDVVYGQSNRCGDCGKANDGTEWIYAVMDGVASPAAKPKVIYTVDGGETWAAQDISTAANADTTIAIDIAGDILFVVVKGSGTSNEMYWTQINPVTGAPGATWTKITTGFVANKKVNDVFVELPNAVYFAADDGVIYKSTDITAGVTTLATLGAGVDDFMRIHGDGNGVLVAVGDSAMVYKSINSGATWTVTTTLPGAAELSAIAVMEEFRFWVGDTTGAVYYTLDGGETWTADTKAAPSATAIEDIVAATDEVIHISYPIAGPVGKLSTTWNGGETWTQRSPRISGLPTYESGNRIAVPTTENPAIDSNNICIVGLDATTDGVIVLGIAAVQ
jgi:photosystem II stability/assembly factor-like uncharacterized protein